MEPTNAETLTDKRTDGQTNSTDQLSFAIGLMIDEFWMLVGGKELSRYPYS